MSGGQMYWADVDDATVLAGLVYSGRPRFSAHAGQRSVVYGTSLARSLATLERIHFGGEAPVGWTAGRKKPF